MRMTDIPLTTPLKLLHKYEKAAGEIKKGIFKSVEKEGEEDKIVDNIDVMSQVSKRFLESTYFTRGTPIDDGRIMDLYHAFHKLSKELLDRDKNAYIKSMDTIDKLIPEVEKGIVALLLEERDSQ